MKPPLRPQRNKEILKLFVGFRKFRQRYFESKTSLFERLSSAGQTPKTLIIGCSDSRVDPAILSSASPGELFVIRNVANLVPPFEKGGGYHGVSAAIEFAVQNLRVEHIIILGHRQCGGIRSLMTNGQPRLGSFIDAWVKIAERAKELVLSKYSDVGFEDQCRHCEMESIKISLENLKTFPFVREAAELRHMQILGVYFDLEQGHLYEWDEREEQFKNIQ